MLEEGCRDEECWKKVLGCRGVQCWNRVAESAEMESFGKWLLNHFGRGIQ